MIFAAHQFSSCNDLNASNGKNKNSQINPQYRKKSLSFYLYFVI